MTNSKVISLHGHVKCHYANGHFLAAFMAIHGDSWIFLDIWTIQSWSPYPIDFSSSYGVKRERARQDLNLRPSDS
jgi:hypothetical protein